MKKKLKKYPDGGTLPKSTSGNSSHTIVMGEEVVPGSPRHKELLALEEKKAAYNSQQEYINSLGLSPKPLTVDKFNSKYPILDESFIPPTSGTTVKLAGGGKLGSYIGDGTKMLGDTLLSTIGLSDVIGDQAYKNQGMADASRTAETIGKYTGQIAATAIGGPMAGMAVSQGQKVLGGIDGEDQRRQHMDQISSLQEQGALGKFNNGAYSMNPGFNTANAIATGAGEIGNVLANPGTIAGIKDSLSNFNLPTFNNGGILNYSKQVLSNPVINQNPNTVSGGPKDLGIFDSMKYAYKTNQNNKDISNITGMDYTKIGALDYKNQNYNTPKFPNGGTITVNGITPEMNTQTTPFYATDLDYNNMLNRMGLIDGATPTDTQMNTIKNTLPVHQTGKTRADLYQQYPMNVNQDAVSLFMDQQNTLWNKNHPIKAFEGNIKKYPDGGQLPQNNTQPYFQTTDKKLSPYYQTNEFQKDGIIQTVVDPNLIQANIMGSIGNIGKITPLVTTQTPIKTYAEGGEFIEYNGPTHEGGGVPINQHGQPTAPQAAHAEVEGGETMHDDGIDKYVFSDRLMLDPKSKTTFADESKKINRKYKDVKDKFQKQARDMELNRLKQSQEQFKATIAQGQSTQQSVQPKMWDGGPITPYSNELLDEMQYGNIGRLPMNSIQGIPQNIISNMPGRVQFDLNDFIPAPQENYSLQEENYVKGTSPSGLEKIEEDPNLGNDFELNQNPFKTSPSPWIGSQEDYDALNNPKSYVPETFGKGVRGDYKPEDNNSKKQESGLPQDTINPLGYAASNIGNVYDLFQSAKPAKANNFGRVDLERINLDAQRKELSKQANLAKTTNRENVRSLATSSGQALGNQVIGNAIANSTLGSGLSESYLTEATANNQIGNREKMTNFQVKQNEILADQMDQAKRQSTTSQALHSIGANTQGYTRDLKSDKVGNENNQLWFDAINGNSKYTQLGFDSNGKMVIQLKDGRVITQP